ncbi:MAG: MdtA/MuxA family multidrug efflux RND transporter periplasmic adaptor subunit [Deltaproteobacteria bacterium]|nr:MdtA/MuxA family multidrug efflux RND transporter periplasmic adaptor subunit [Deltaproteobacteria bacterium]
MIFWQRRLWLKQPLWRWMGLGLFLFLAIWAFHTRSKPDKKTGLAVSVATAELGDIPFYLDGLGSVTAYYSVTVRSRVDGQLISAPFTEGHFVQKGEVLAEIDPRPFQAQLAQAEGQLAKDEALLTNARLDLQRYKGLFAQNAVSKQQLDTQVALVAQDEGVVKSDRGAVAAAKLQLNYCHIASPIGGRIGLRLVDPGNMVHASDANGLLLITQLQPITIVFTLPEDNIPKIMEMVNKTFQLTVEAYNRDKSQKLASGKLLTLDNQIDPNTGTLKLKAVFDNKDNLLFPNQFVNVRLLLETKQDQVLIPPVAVQRGSQGTFVYVVAADNKVEMRPVKLGLVEGNNALIESGLQPGETVVIDGADKLQPGSSVKVQAPNNNSNASDAASTESKPGTRKSKK